MSIVTDLFLLTSVSFDPDDNDADSRSFDQISAWLLENAGGQELKRLDRNYDAYGGHKAFQASIWCGALNQVDIWAFIEFLRTLDFGDWAQVVYQHEFDAGFTLVQVQPADPFDAEPSAERAARRYNDLTEELEQCNRCRTEPAWLVRWSVDWRLDPPGAEWRSAVQQQSCRGHGIDNVSMLIGGHASLVTASDLQLPTTPDLDLTPPDQPARDCQNTGPTRDCRQPARWWIAWIDGDARKPGRFDLPGASACLCSEHASTNVEYIMRQGVAAVGARRFTSPIQQP